MAEDNIYAPPQTIIDPKELDKTTYLEHDGYSERGMLLCNEYFVPPLVCLKSGDAIEPHEQPTSRCVSRYLPSIWESKKVKQAWLIRVLLLLTYPLFMKNIFWVLLFLPIFLIAHLVLNYFSANKIIINVHVKASVVMKRRVIQLSLSLISLVSAFIYVIQLYNFSSQQNILIPLVTLIISSKFVLASGILLKFIHKKGDFYYLRGAHPFFLAALPLRSLDE